MDPNRGVTFKLSAGKFVTNSVKQIQKCNLAYSLVQFLKSLGKVTYKEM
jgi:hypothetical protein